MDSVLQQSYSHIELIIVDDGSDEHYSDLLANLAKKDERIKLVRNESNLGLPRSLNVGFRASTGAFLSWTSDDNYYLPSAVATMCASLMSDDGLSIVASAMECIDEHGHIVKIFSPGPIEALYRLNIVGACFMYRRSVHVLLGDYDSNYTLVEDWDFFLRAHLSGLRFGFLSDILYCYRSHPASLTQSRSRQARFARDRMISDYIEHMQNLSNDKRATLLFTLSKRSIRSGHFKLGVSCFAGAIKADVINAARECFATMAAIIRRTLK